MKTKYILALVLLALGFSSCELEEQSYGKPTVDNILSDPENAALLVGQVYADIKWLHDHWGYWGVLTISSDECVVPIRRPNDWNDNGYWTNINTMEWTTEDQSFEFVWNYSVKGATLCNQIIQQLQDAKEAIGDDVFNQYYAELVVARSYYFYTMFDAFGRIPYSSGMADDASKRDLLSVQDSWTALVKDLEENASKLPLANNPSKAQNYGRVTRGFAHALLAKLYLNAASYGLAETAENYTKSVAYCDSVIESNVYTTSSSFFDNFLIKNENSEENIFVIVENGDASFDYRDVAGKMANKLRIVMLSLHYAHQETWDLLEKPWNGFSATPEFMALYQEGDVRGACDGTNADKSKTGTGIDFTIEENKRGWFLGPVFDPLNPGDTLRNVTDDTTAPVVIVNEYDNVAACSPNAGARCMKYEVERGTRSTSGNKYCENDFVLMRYADVLYMKAEAQLRGGSSTFGDVTTRSDFQNIRQRAGLTGVFSPSIDDMLDERGREFAWEFSRRRDLIRYGKYTQGVWTGKPNQVDEYRKWFPIPSKILEVSGEWTQNDGYPQ